MAPDWITDCSACLGLCCVAFAHEPGNGFPCAKAENTACRHLTDGFRCGVFDGLEDRGYAVCRPYDCFGAGPVVAARMRAEREVWTRAELAAAVGHLDGFRDLARLRMLIAALGRQGPEVAPGLIEGLAAAAEAFRQTGEVRIDRATAAGLRDHEALVERILAVLSGTATTDDGETER